MTRRTFPGTALTAIALLAAPAGALEPPKKGATTMTTTAIEKTAAKSAAPLHDGERDFDFLLGRYRLKSRRLEERLKGSTEWIEFEATNVARLLPGGLGNQDEFRTDWNGGIVGTTFRFYDPKTKLWSIYWADSRSSKLEPPVVGSFQGDVGTFFGNDTHDGTPVRVRFIWTKTNPDAPRWEQAFSTDGGKTWETNWIMDFSRPEDRVDHLQNLQVFEIRRYTVQPGTRERFARCFEAWFPEALEQAGAVVAGQFFERGRRDAFTWIRGYANMDVRAAALGAFYFGPVWKEHRQTMNEMIVDSDDVLLLRPYAPDRGVPIRPAIDPTAAPPAKGVVVAQILPAAPLRVDDLAREAAPHFARYRASGAKELALLVTHEAKNNFPQHPVRPDGPYLVWLGLVSDEGAFEKVRPLAEDAAASLAKGGTLRGAAELVHLTPTDRSRLR